MNKEIQMRKLVEFCDRYNSISYGDAEIIELQSVFIVKLYNGGFSENEELDVEFRNKYKDLIILDRHPVLIAEFSKLDLKYNYHVVGFDNLKDWCGCYSADKVFKYVLRVE